MTSESDSAGLQMLSPHEIAALMLVRHAGGHRQIDPADLEVLVGKRLVTLEQDAGQHQLRLTSQGLAMLAAIGKHR